MAPPARHAEPSRDGGVDCATVQGLQHTIIDTSKAGAALPIEALVGADVDSVKVVVMYRPEGATEFTEVKLKKEGECKYTGAIPASAMKGSLLHYYVAALRRGPQAGRVEGLVGLAEHHRAARAAGGTGGGDNEDPIGPRHRVAASGGGRSVVAGVRSRARKKAQGPHRDRRAARALATSPARPRA